MNDRTDERPERRVTRPWDNTGLRHRIEGRQIDDDVDVLALQVSVLEREAHRPRRRFRAR